MIPGELTHDEVFNFCQQIVDLKIPYMAISGGEPMLHKDFFDICEFIRRLIVRDVKHRPRWEDENLFKTIKRVRKESFGAGHTNLEPIPGFTE